MAKILVIDDDSAIRNFTAVMLKGAGDVVTLATSVADGRRAYQEGNFDLVLCDNNCPREDAGRDWLKELLAQGQKVLLMPSMGVDDLGDLPFIMKPFTRAELLTKIAEVLGSPTA